MNAGSLRKSIQYSIVAFIADTIAYVLLLESSEKFFNATGVGMHVGIEGLEGHLLFFFVFWFVPRLQI